jgi:hypothetical protein
MRRRSPLNQRGWVRIILPCGTLVLGWHAAAAQLKRNRKTVQLRSDWDNQLQAWRVREPRRKGRG